MKNRDIKGNNYIGWARESSGYLKQCFDCKETIYLHLDNDSTWRPYESWVAGNASEGEFIPHQCKSAPEYGNFLSTPNEAKREKVSQQNRTGNIDDVLKRILE
jgi:hypothetical protein